ncbi:MULTISPECIES: carbohydrate ABC transporter permease [Streptomycetaceae]|uniref:carbohydrate ABC transporter permease n=1 Tax=Streptomycetaceae TaxID=2062 RepID=UPI0030085E91
MAEARSPRKGSHFGVHTVLIAASLVMVAPFVWEAITSLKSLTDATHVPPSPLPGGQWSNYRKVFQLLPFGHQFLNTLLMALGRTAGQVVLCPMAAYAFARLRFPGRGVLFGLFLSVLMVPPQLFIIPQYQIMSDLGWLNSLQALILPGMFSAFGVFLLRQSFLSLPKELEEAARIDGAGPLRIYWSVMLPLVRPGLVALGVLALLWSWNDLFWPLVVNTDPDKMTLSAGLASLQGQFQTDYPVLMAGSLLASLPVIVVFAFLQRQFVQGIAHTGVKG